MSIALAEQPTSVATQESSHGSRGVLRRKSAEEKARAEKFKEVKSVLGTARTAFATEVRSASKKTKDSEYGSFTAYESALSDYLTYIMHSQGFAMAEMARIGERDVMGALWRAKNKVKFWGTTAALTVGTGVVRTGVGIAAGVVLNKLVYTPVSKWVTNTLSGYTTESIMAKRQKEAREASSDGVDFKAFTGSENLLDKDLSSRFKKVSSYLRKERLARLALSVTSGTGVALLTGGGISSHILHDHMAGESIGDVVSEHVGENVSRFLTEGVTPQAGAFLGFLFGSKAMAAELPMTSGGAHAPAVPAESGDVVRSVSGVRSEVGGTTSSEPFASPSANSGEFNMQDEIEGRRYFVSPTDTGEGLRVPNPHDVHLTVLGTDPFAPDAETAFTPGYLNRAADLLVKGGMPLEFRQAFIDAAMEARVNMNHPNIVIDGRFQAEAMVSGHNQVLGEGAGIVTLDPRVPYPAQEFSRDVLGSDGKMYHLVWVRPEKCNNFSYMGATLIETPPPPVEAIIIPPPPAEVVPPPRPPTEVFLKRDPLICIPHGDGSSCDVPTNAYLIFDERGMSVPDAQERVRDLVLGEDRRGTESILIENYQGNIPSELRFVPVRITDASGKVTYWCMSTETGRYSHPYVTIHGRDVQVRTEEQWQALINGAGNVVNPEDPIIPLVAVDTNSNGIPDKLMVRREDVPVSGPARAN